MHTANVREMDGSLVITVPPEVAEELQLKPGTQVQVRAEGDRLTLTAKRPRYKLEHLLAECDFTQPISTEEQEWMDAPLVGREVLS